jgi:hypothetical protein
MTVDTRARRAAQGARDTVAAIDIPRPHTIERRVQRRRRTGAALILAVVVALAVSVGVAVANHTTTPAVSTHGQRSPRWDVISKQDAGIGRWSTLDAVASNGDVALLAGAVQVGNGWRVALWRSTDGVHWSQSSHPQPQGEISAVALHGSDALAIGSKDTGNVIWRSADGGRSWHLVSGERDRFGPDASHMGRPFVSRLTWFAGWWVAAGGASDGYAGVWVSRDGTTWRQTLSSHESGSVNVVPGRDGVLLAYVFNSIWSTTDPTRWGSPTRWSVPDRMYLGSLADGGDVALAFSFDRHDQPTPLLRADAARRRFVGVPGLPADVPNASGWTVQRVRDLWIVAGWRDQPNQHPAAWVSDDLVHWDALPKRLEGAPGGVLSLVARVGHRIVILGTAPELDRFYTLTR